jgi:hypothetical protein
MKWFIVKPTRRWRYRMEAQSRLGDALSSAYVLGLLGVVGVFALISAVLIAWPALAYLGSKIV